MKQKVFFTPQYPTEPKKGMGHIVINRDVAESIGIQTSSPSELKLLGKIKAKSDSKARELEKSLHKTFDKYH